MIDEVNANCDADEARKKYMIYLFLIIQNMTHSDRFKEREEWQRIEF
jgi:hypothetical protein